MPMELRDFLFCLTGTADSGVQAYAEQHDQHADANKAGKGQRTANAVVTWPVLQKIRLPKSRRLRKSDDAVCSAYIISWRSSSSIHAGTIDILTDCHYANSVRKKWGQAPRRLGASPHFFRTL